MERYEMRERIGKGSFGVVDKYIDRESNSYVAVKSIKVAHQKLIKREISALEALQHENIVRLMNVVDSDNCSCLVFEFLDIDLAMFIRDGLFSNFSCSMPNSMTKGEVKSHIVKKFLFQILQGVSYCHSQNFMHRDLKPANLLIDLKSLTIKLADFGLARKLDNAPYTPKRVTLSYRSPELLCYENNYSTAVDIWSIGCVFAEMVASKRLFPDDTLNKSVNFKFDTIHSWFKTEAWPKKEDIFQDASLLEKLSSQNKMELAGFVPDIGDAGLDLLSEMLSVNPKNRITADEALKHHYFENFQYSLQLDYKKPN